MKAEIVEELEALATHYPRPNRTPDQQSRFLRDYLEDLGSISFEAVKRACQRWRQSDETRYPTSGQLRKFATAANATGEKSIRPRAWAWSSDEEFDRMSLDDKIFEIECRMNKTLRDAGPMWRQPPGQKPTRSPLTPDQMPPKWHEAQARAKVWRAMIKDLRTKIATSEARKAMERLESQHPA